MATTLQIREDQAVVHIAGRASVSSASETKERLLEAFGSGHPVAVDLGELTEADLSLLQLLLSAEATAAAERQSFVVERHGFAFEQLLKRSGFASLLEAPWVQSGERVQFFFFDEEA